MAILGQYDRYHVCLAIVRYRTVVEDDPQNPGEQVETVTRNVVGGANGVRTLIAFMTKRKAVRAARYIIKFLLGRIYDHMEEARQRTGEESGFWPYDRAQEGDFED